MSVVSPETTAVVAGSFKPEHLRFIQNTVGLLTEIHGIQVLAPHFTTVSNPSGEFAILDTDDPNASPRALEQRFMDTITDAELVVFANHRYLGRLGLSAAAEMAHARLAGTPILITHETKIWDYPEVWFSDEVTAEEQRALEPIPFAQFPVWPPLDLGRIRQEKERCTPLPTDHPDYPILAGLRGRLLASLPG